MRRFPIILFAILVSCSIISAGDYTQWGGTDCRNMVSEEKNLPLTFEPKTNEDGSVSGRNVKWAARIGTHTYGNPVIGNGRVIVGSNDASLDDDRLKKTRGGMIYCFDEKTGKKLWQLVIPRFKTNDRKFNYDHLNLGMCSAATLEGDRAYVVDNHGYVLCLDAKGQADGNDGPYKDEGQFMAGEGKKAVEIRPTDGDIIWCYNIVRELPVWPQDATSSAILIIGDMIIAGTSNGVNMTHWDVPLPDAPSLIVLDKNTGKLLAKDDEKIGRRMLHGQWSSPSLGEVNGKKQIYYGGGDGQVYAFEVPKKPKDDSVAILKKVWSCDANPHEYRFKPDGTPMQYQRVYGTHKNKVRGTGPSEIIGTPVFYKNRIYVAIGQDPHHKTGKGCLSCIDATKTGDITKTGIIWQSKLVDRSLSTVSIVDGLLYVLDYSGMLHCFDVEKGNRYWVHDTGSRIWSSTFVAGGKIYLGTDKREFWTFEAGRQKKILAKSRLLARMYITPVAANGVLFVATEKYMYAIAEEKK